MKKWKSAPQEAVKAFEAATAGLLRAEPRKMFGYSCVFAKGNMFAGLHEAEWSFDFPKNSAPSFFN